MSMTDKPKYYRVMLVNATTSSPLGVIMMYPKDWDWLSDKGSYTINLEQSGQHWRTYSGDKYELCYAEMRQHWRIDIRCEYIPLEDSMIMALLVTDECIDIKEQVGPDEEPVPGAEMANYVSALIRVLYACLDEERGRAQGS
jgi:hypothetical protein